MVYYVIQIKQILLSFKETKCIKFIPREKHKNILENHSKLRSELIDLIGKEFYSKPIWNDKHLKMKAKSYKDAIKTDFSWWWTTNRKNFMQSLYNNAYKFMMNDENYYPKTISKEYK